MMKRTLANGLALLLLMAGLPAGAETNDIKGLMQRGLFEEEANQNLPAAMEAYQDIVNKFNETRSLTATAIFRLGECYRKQGRTNDAVAQYQRIIREFSDQTNLAALSQQNLSGPGASIAASEKPYKPYSFVEEYLRAIRDLTNNASDPQIAKATWEEAMRLVQAMTNRPSGVASSVATNEPARRDPYGEITEIERLKAMIKESPDLLNAPNNEGDTLLADAVKAGQIQVVQFLLGAGADIERPAHGEHPIAIAVNNGNKPMVSLLLSSNANVNSLNFYENIDDNTPLHLAAVRGNLGMVQLLIEHGANVNVTNRIGVTPLHVAVARSYRTTAESLLAHHADPNTGVNGSTYYMRASFFGTPLHSAVNRSDEAMIRLLLGYKADPNKTDSNGKTPLALAVDRGDASTVKLLIASGANPNVKDSNGETPLALAATRGDASTVNLLLANGADPNLVSRKASPLYNVISHASEPALTEIVSALLAHGADPNWFGDNNLPPLMVAVRRHAKSVVGLLLHHKTDLNARSKIELGLPVDPGSTALNMIAQMPPHPDLLEIAGMLLNARPGTNIPGPILYVLSYRGPNRVGQYTLSGEPINPSLISEGSTALAISGDQLFVAGGEGVVGLYRTDGTAINSKFLTNLGINPLGLAVSPNSLYAANQSGGTIKEYTFSGKLVKTVVSGLETPAGLTLDGDKLYVGSWSVVAQPGAVSGPGWDGTGYLGVYSTSGDTINSKLVKGGSPWKAVVAGDYIYVSDYSHGKIGKYTRAGKAVNENLITGLGNPQGMVIWDKKLYVADGMGTIGVYTLNGEAVNASLISGLDDPIDIAITREGVSVGASAGPADPNIPDVLGKTALSRIVDNISKSDKKRQSSGSPIDPATEMPAGSAISPFDYWSKMAELYRKHGATERNP